MWNNQFRSRMKISSGILMVLLCAAGKACLLHAHALKTMDYVTMKDGRVYLIENNESAFLEQPLKLTPQLTVLTNGTIKIAGDGEEELNENRRVTLDGFWLNDDGTLVSFQPHYMIKDRVLYFVKSGVFKRVDQDVTFGNGIVLRTDGALLIPDGRLIRLQDGQMLTVTGQTIPALDQVMMIDGKLVLQKDGSIIPLPVRSTIGMSDGTTVTGNGLITRPTGEQFMLDQGQRLTLDGAAMSKIQ